jgi:hypothetical protein
VSISCHGPVPCRRYTRIKIAGSGHEDTAIMHSASFSGPFARQAGETVHSQSVQVAF